MASLIPWKEFEEEYASIFSEYMGAPACRIFRSNIYQPNCKYAHHNVFDFVHLHFLKKEINK